jgi:hypothetical protein
MFVQNNTEKNATISDKTEIDATAQSKYKNIINLYPGSDQSDEMNYNTIDKLLESEKQHNKTETWNKLDKTIKIQKLHAFAEKYGKEHSLPVKDVKSLKAFFVDCLEKNKLQKTKEVNYDKNNKEILSIPALFFNSSNHNFTLKIIDSKRVSTLKSLTPKRVHSNDHIVQLEK